MRLRDCEIDSARTCRHLLHHPRLHRHSRQSCHLLHHARHGGPCCHASSCLGSISPFLCPGLSCSRGLSAGWLLTLASLKFHLHLFKTSSRLKPNKKRQTSLNRVTQKKEKLKPDLKDPDLESLLTHHSLAAGEICRCSKPWRCLFSPHGSSPWQSDFSRQIRSGFGYTQRSRLCSSISGDKPTISPDSSSLRSIRPAGFG